MKNKIEQICVETIGWLKQTDNIKFRNYVEYYQLIKVVVDSERKYVFQCFDFDGNIAREVNSKYVICVDYKE